MASGLRTRDFRLAIRVLPAAAGAILVKLAVGRPLGKYQGELAKPTR